MVRIIQGEYSNIKAYIGDILQNKYFDFNFTFTEENEVFREINRFIWESKHLHTRFKNRYSGPVAVCLSEWNNERLNNYFDIFMYFLKDISSDSDIYLYVESCISECISKRIEYFFPKIKKVDLQLTEEKVTRRIGFYIQESEEMEEMGNV